MRPKEIPVDPAEVYSGCHGWVSWSDWLGTPATASTAEDSAGEATGRGKRRRTASTKISGVYVGDSDAAGYAVGGSKAGHRGRARAASAAAASNSSGSLKQARQQKQAALALTCANPLFAVGKGSGNQPMTPFNPKKYRGITHYATGKTEPWRAQIWHPSTGPNRKLLNLGMHPTAEEAARVYDRNLIKFRGQDAKTNFPIGEYDVPSLLREAELDKAPQAIEQGGVGEKVSRKRKATHLTQKKVRVARGPMGGSGPYAA